MIFRLVEDSGVSDEFTLLNIDELINWLVQKNITGDVSVIYKKFSRGTLSLIFIGNVLLNDREHLFMLSPLKNLITDDEQDKLEKFFNKYDSCLIFDYKQVGVFNVRKPYLIIEELKEE